MIRPNRTLRTVTCLAILSLAAAPAGAGAVFQIQNLDAPGEGFNDPTPWTPTGGNPATTLGQARLNAFTYAAAIWGEQLTSNVVIRVEARMDDLYCTPTAAVLGYAGATTVHMNFNGAPRPQTLYPQAMANALAGVDLNPARGDISAVFSSALVGDSGCLGGADWYYGYDSNRPAGDVDFISTVLHELGHGLGFQTFVDVETGEKLGGYDDMFMINIERAGAVPSDFPSMSNAQRAAACTADPQLRWTGFYVSYRHKAVPLVGGLNDGYVRLHAPNPLRVGSSVSHWSTAVLPNELMEPALNGVFRDPGLATYLMKDLGWQLERNVASVFDTTNSPAADLAQNHPNPFNAGTELRFSLSRSGHVSLQVYDLAGRVVRTLVDDTRSAGDHVAFWDGRDDAGRPLASGAYLYRLETDSSAQVRRMVLMK